MAITNSLEVSAKCSRQIAGQSMGRHIFKDSPINDLDLGEIIKQAQEILARGICGIDCPNDCQVKKLAESDTKLLRDVFGILENPVAGELPSSSS